MSGSQIPNLLEKLNTSTPTRSGRARAPKQVPESRDEIIRGTDSDALGSRLSAVEQGYLEDPFVQVFATSGDGVRRMPIINRGTYLRTRAIDLLVEKFLKLTGGANFRQIISIGAGTDTRAFRLIYENPNLVHNLHYHELDFVETTIRKVSTIARTPFVLSLLQDAASRLTTSEKNQLSIEPEKGLLSSQFYSVHGVDIRTLADSMNPANIARLSPTAPTLILSECCLTYVPEPVNTNILKHFAEGLVPSPANLCVVLYEPLHPDDTFGRTMASNLALRGIDMPSLHATPTIELHIRRLIRAGFNESSRGATIRDIWEFWVGEEEKVRLRELEMFDEEEEWILLSAHYGLIWAERGNSTSFTTGPFIISKDGKD